MSIEMNGLGAIPEAFGGPMVNYPTSRKGKQYTSEIERLVFVYNQMDPRAKKTITYGLLLGYFALLLIFRLFTSDFATLATVSALLTSIYALFFAFWLAAFVFRHDEGDAAMQNIAEPIREGSEGFFAVQYGTIAKISLLAAFLLFVLYISRDDTVLSAAGGGKPTRVSSLSMALITACTFLIGAFCSALAGYAGMWVSVRANVRVSSAARRCYNTAIQLCFRAGGFASLVNVAMVIGGLSFIMIVLRVIYPTLEFQQAPLLLVGYGFGASLVAMFAQLGGGIYTKGADVGADLVGKVEAGIPEDDPRNPATIADLVGDNVGDCAGQCADTFESIAAEILSAMILGGSLADEGSMNKGVTAGFVAFPLAVHCMDMLVSSMGMMLIRAKKGMPTHSAKDTADEDPMKIMKRAYSVTLFLATIGFMILCRWFLWVPNTNSWAWFFGCGTVGMACSYLFVIITQYYTDYEHNKVRSIAYASTTGPATNIIAGMAVGLESTAAPVLCISIALVSSYYMGTVSSMAATAGVVPASDASISGLFGTAVATMGMLSTAVFVLAMSNFGPIADNAGGIVEMSQQSDEVRLITDKLDAVGNVTKANTKGFSVGTAALACFLLFAAFMDEVSVYTGKRFESVDLARCEVFVGGILGACLVFLFAAWAMNAVGRAAAQVVTEVRRQFKERPGIMDWSDKPDYYTCIAIVSRSALKEMIRPGALAALSPVVVGFVFRVIGSYRGDTTLGAQVIAAFLMFSTAAGILMALFLNNAGGAWDNAKKYIEITGSHGGKNSEAHKASVVGDTVGDPCKDTAGPSVHVLIKLVSTVTMVLTPVFCGQIATGSGPNVVSQGGIIP
ncbi:Pyrophosphate-energized membrane proton pump, putative [Perkinsus marinus ATCC 50983]|uniref:H(+)-exporting diphosphatase n=1 Tax=Perkinsus marinus (strain ATCC 50983 / TXsc) TaxID=423536 RepID=C5L3L9_PERM5|nr:Pyrophosphate-energized membrane proton pump, putative [Perkinsus marinus ATCC 50983]EER08598.1 Pyrophosphate-energized membrane proton pump, putative [Perkinsus marinus ATCC 50983]|eukprot:XP_002776782.1 Pyrophosphate-energized membrane proton pump, putative [Perkinsus marinus ATCC 50983]